ncbi:MAG: hypothetical protein CFE24_14605 [Flavobacterium sp. BFFFF2]|nr:MAG: hypothetical protein CFE24_14605 [Flavobacterium sp. BFFFF2]
MNQTHIHLLVNHLPIFGSLLGAIVLAYGLWSKSNDTKMAAYLVFIIAALGAVTAYLTGEAAEESVEHLPGVLESAVEAHAEFAMFALVSLLILGVASLLGMIVTVNKSPLTRSAAIIILLISLVSFGLVATTGYLGGQIRHTEITAAGENAELDAD